MSLISAALGLVARLSAQEAHSAAAPDGAEKAGKIMSAKNVKTVQGAIGTLKELLAAAGEAEDGGDNNAAKAGEENLQVTKEELFAWLDERDATKAAAAEQEEAAKAAAQAEAAGTQSQDDEANKSAVITPELLTEAVAKGVQVALSPLQERLETVEKMAAPGGPVKTRPQETLTKAAEKDTLELQAAEYERRARGLNSDPERFRKAYEGKAAETRTAIAALVG